MKVKKYKHVGCRVTEEDYMLLERILHSEKISEAEFFRTRIREYGVDSYFKKAYLKMEQIQRDVLLNQKLLSLLVSLQYDCEPTDENIERTLNFIKGMKKKIFMGL